LTVEWQELPGWLPSESGLPLERPRLWQPYLTGQQYYKVVLQLLSAGHVLVTKEFLTNIGTGTNLFNVTVPTVEGGPFTWQAYLQTVPNALIDMVDSFEDRDTGTNSPPPVPPLYAPWELLMYAQNTNVQSQMYFDSGVDTNSSDGAQALFTIVTNPPTVGTWSGSFLRYTYPQFWALPRDLSQWTDYTFSFDFEKTNRLPSVLEMQVKDGQDGQLHFVKTYTPAGNGWDTIRASLDAFEVPPWVGHFDPENVSQLIVNIQMQQTSVVYKSSIQELN
jgi:hypothetical protein